MMATKEELKEVYRQFLMTCFEVVFYPRINLREFACLTTVILAPLRMDGGLHAGSAMSLPVMPLMRLMPLARDRSIVFLGELV